jgi:hypothetical protein
VLGEQRRLNKILTFFSPWSTHKNAALLCIVWYIQQGDISHENLTIKVIRFEQKMYFHFNECYGGGGREDEKMFAGERNKKYDITWSYDDFLRALPSLQP